MQIIVNNDSITNINDVKQHYADNGGKFYSIDFLDDTRVSIKYQIDANVDSDDNPHGWADVDDFYFDKVDDKGQRIYS